MKNNLKKLAVFASVLVLGLSANAEEKQDQKAETKDATKIETVQNVETKQENTQQVAPEQQNATQVAPQVVYVQPDPIVVQRPVIPQIVVTPPSFPVIQVPRVEVVPETQIIIRERDYYYAPRYYAPRYYAPRVLRRYDHRRWDFYHHHHYHGRGCW